MKRFALILDGWNNISVGQLVNAGAIAIGGLKSDGFEEKIGGADGNPHSAIRFNMPVLKAKKPSDFQKAIKNLKDNNIEYVVFCREAQHMSNSFDEYKLRVSTNDSLSIISIAIYGEDEAVRGALKFLSAFT